jgi:hypothetical protein
MQGERAGRASPGRAGLLVACVLLGCPAAAGNPGYDPPANQLAFPSGLLLDPRVSTEPGAVCDADTPCEGSDVCTSANVCRTPARWLFVTNANSARSTNAGTLLAIDLDAFHRAAFDDPGAIHPATTSLSPESVWSENSPVCGNSSNDGRWCRRVANLPQVVECLEEPFVCSEATIHFGNFPGPTAAWDQVPGDDEAMLLIPVRGDPSITYAELSGGLDGDDLRFECGQASDEDGGRKCDDLHRLRFFRNDPEGSRLAREPFRVLVSTEPGRPVAYVSHQGDPDLTLFALDGLSSGGDGRPAMVHQAELLGWDASIIVQGGFGLAQRPCDVDSGNAPNATLGCTRPMIYAGMRWRPEVRTLTAINYDLPICSDADALADFDPDLAVGYCEVQAELLRYIGSLGQLSTIDVPLQASRPILADIGFSRSGNELYIVQSNPGGLLRLDTSIAIDGETLDVPAGQVEVCAQPTSFTIYDDGGSQFGVVTCYRSGEVFIVDLASLKVVGVSRAGIGPDALAVDLAREVVYVANSLDGTISVLDMSPARSSRFTQIARIGLQEPYSQ